MLALSKLYKLNLLKQLFVKMIIFRSRNFQLSWAVSEINVLPLEGGILAVCVAVLVVAVWGPRDCSFGHAAPWKAGVRICWSSMEEYKRGCQSSYWQTCIRCTHTVIGPTSVYTWSQFSGIWPVSDLPLMLKSKIHAMESLKISNMGRSSDCWLEPVQCNCACCRQTLPPVSQRITTAALPMCDLQENRNIHPFL